MLNVIDEPITTPSTKSTTTNTSAKSETSNTTGKIIVISSQFFPVVVLLKAAKRQKRLKNSCRRRKYTGKIDCEVQCSMQSDTPLLLFQREIPKFPQKSTRQIVFVFSKSITFPYKLNYKVEITLFKTQIFYSLFIKVYSFFSTLCLPNV